MSNISEFERTKPKETHKAFEGRFVIACDN